MGQIEVSSEIPSNHPEKRAIEETVRGVLAPRLGTWHVTISRSHTDPSWWVLTLERASALLGPFRHSFILAPEQQTASRVRAILNEAERIAESERPARRQTK